MIWHWLAMAMASRCPEKKRLSRRFIPALFAVGFLSGCCTVTVTRWGSSDWDFNAQEALFNAKGDILIKGTFEGRAVGDRREWPVPATRVGRVDGYVTATRGVLERELRLRLTSPAYGYKPSDVINLSMRMSADGRTGWTMRPPSLIARPEEDVQIHRGVWPARRARYPNQG
jgi:hypothetical protein